MWWPSPPMALIVTVPPVEVPLVPLASIEHVELHTIAQACGSARPHKMDALISTFGKRPAVD